MSNKNIFLNTSYPFLMKDILESKIKAEQNVKVKTQIYKSLLAAIDSQLYLINKILEPIKIDPECPEVL